MPMNIDKFARSCDKIYRIVGEPVINGEDVSEQVIRSYYTHSSFYYRKFHSPEGAMHVPVSFADGVPHLHKLQYQARFVESLISRYNYTRVLELGFGMGFNTRYLAQRNPQVQFTGIDLTASNVKRARQKAKNLPNTTFMQDSFDEPEHTSQSYDLIFAVETLCHSKDMAGVLERYAHLLSENGRLVVFDGLKKRPEALPDKISARAYQLLLWGFALERFFTLDDIMNSEKLHSLKFEAVTEYSKNVLPNMLTFQRGAYKALRFPGVLKMLLRLGILPLELIKQIAAGLTSAYFLEKRYLGYYKLVLVKK